MKDIAIRCGIEEYLEYYGNYKAKIKYNEVKGNKGKLILDKIKRTLKQYSSKRI